MDVFLQGGLVSRMVGTAVACVKRLVSTRGAFIVEISTKAPHDEGDMRSGHYDTALALPSLLSAPCTPFLCHANPRCTRQIFSYAMQTLTFPMLCIPTRNPSYATETLPMLIQLRSNSGKISRSYSRRLLWRESPLPSCSMITRCGSTCLRSRVVSLERRN